MGQPNRRAKTRVELVADHLKSRGHISEGSAFVEYGRFRLGAAIHRLRNGRRDLIPADMDIITIHKLDTKGDPYGEYHLVPKASAAERKRVLAARAGEGPPASV